MILIRAENTTVALKMRKNARNNKINLITKIVIIKSFVCFYKSRMKRAIIRKTTEIVTIVKRKNILQRIVSNSSKIIFKLTLWKVFDKTFNKTNKKRFYHELSSKFQMIQVKKLNEFAMIVVAIANRKKKFWNVFIELYVQIKNKWKKKIIILNDEI